MQKNWTFSVRGSQISAQKHPFVPKTAILAKESCDFSARIVAVRASRTSGAFGASRVFRASRAFRTFSSNQPICYLSTRYVICLPHPDSRHIAQTADYLHVSKNVNGRACKRLIICTLASPPINILETWIFRRLAADSIERFRL